MVYYPPRNYAAKDVILPPILDVGERPPPYPQDMMFLLRVFLICTAGVACPVCSPH